MSNLDKKTTILLHIKSYCEEIINAFKFFGKDYEAFQNNPIYRNAISMPLFQICELAKILNKEYKEYVEETKNEIAWKDIIRMRERFAHHYLDMDYGIIYETALNDIPKLKKEIIKEIKKQS